MDNDLSMSGDEFASSDDGEDEMLMPSDESAYAPVKGIAILYDQLTSPRMAVLHFAERRPYWIAVLVIILAALSRTTGGMLIGATGGFAGGIAFWLLVFMAQLAISFVVLVVSVGIYHFAATNDEKLGDARVLFLLISAALLPHIFLGPLAIVARAVPVGMPVYVLGALILLLWGFILKIVAIKNYYEVSSFKSFLIVILPYILLALLVIPLVLVMIAGLVTSLQGFFG